MVELSSENGEMERTPGGGGKEVEVSGARFEQARELARGISSEDEVENTIAEKLHVVSRQSVFIQLAKLALTLVELAKVALRRTRRSGQPTRSAGAKEAHLLKSYPCVDLVHCTGKVILDALDLARKKGVSRRLTRARDWTHRQVLSHALELVADVAIVPFFFPLGLEKVKRFLQDRQGSDGGGVGNLCAPSSAPSSPCPSEARRYSRWLIAERASPAWSSSRPPSPCPSR